MGLNKIWVYGEAGADGVATITLEMLAKARQLAGTVEVFLGGDGSRVAAELGDHGASRVYATGDLGGAMQGVAVASAGGRGDLGRIAGRAGRVHAGHDLRRARAWPPGSRSSWMPVCCRTWST